MGNRQGGKMAPRQDLSYQPKNRKRTGKAVDESNVDADPLPSELHPALFQSIRVHSVGILGTTPSSALHPQAGSGNTFHDDNPNLVSKILQDEMYAATCLQDDRRSINLKDHFTTLDGGDISDVTGSQGALHSPSAVRREVLRPSNTQNHQDTSREFTVSQVFADLSSSSSFPKRCCLEADPVTKVGGDVKSSAAVTNTAVNCIDRLENLKRNIEQCNTENFTYFNNTGFAQLQNEADCGDYDNADNSKESEACAHRRNKSMSPKTTVLLGVPQLDGRNKSKAVRKLSEPSQFIYRKDSMSSKSIIPGAWSKSAENSPVIVRKALPNPGSPVIVRKTPTQSPSVERRFPANVLASSVFVGQCAESFDSSKARLHVYQKVLSKHQDCMETREASHSIRQMVTAEISLPHVPSSPMNVRKMPESPILHSSAIQLPSKGKDREEPSRRPTGNRNVPAFIPIETSRVHSMKMLTSSSCSSSESESPNRKLPLQEDIASPPIPVCNSSTSSFSAASCNSSPTPIQFCSQPKGTPIRTCTVGSQPSAAVVIASRASRESLQSMDVRMQPTQDAESEGQDRSVQMSDCKATQDVPTSSQAQSSSSAVTEDTIKQNSQSAVFGSVSPKLLRHRRLIKESSNPSHNQHTFPQQSDSIKITTAKTYPRHGESSVVMIDDIACTDFSAHVHKNIGERLAQLSQSAPSSFSTHGTYSSSICVGNKTLGQRIREVINEATVGTISSREKSSLLFGKHEKAFSKDDIFTSTSAHEKCSSYSFSNHPSNKSDKIVPFRNGNQTGLGEETRKAKAAVEPKIKPPFSRAGTKHTAQDTQLRKSAGYSYHVSSSRDSCSSCVSNSSQMDSSVSPCFQGEVAELTQANLCQQTALFSSSLQSKRDIVLGTHLGVPNPRLVSSDTSDTLSTDRDTSGSSKRESSTSTATDDTLTSFKTRSTADSADYEEGFVLPETLVFTRSADKDVRSDVWAFESEQTTIKRKLVQGQLQELRAEHESLSHKTRKKRRKQLPVQSQIITAKREHADGSLKRNRAVRDVYSDDISDDSDLFGSKDDISDLPSSRDDISDLPSSRDDLSDLPSSRDDISDLRSSGDISEFPCSKSHTQNATNRRVFHRSDLHSSVNPVSSCLSENRSMARKTTTDCHAVTGQSDSNVNCTFNKPGCSSRGETLLYSSEIPDGMGSSAKCFPEPCSPDLTSVTGLEAGHPDVPQFARSPTIRPRGRSAATHVGRTGQTDNAEDRDSCERISDTTVYPLCTDQDDDEGRKLLLQCHDSPESKNTVVLSCTIYNSTCRSVDDGD